MPKATVFWVIYLIALLLALFFSYPFAVGGVPTLLAFVLIGLLGWGVYGKMVQ